MQYHPRCTRFAPPDLKIETPLILPEQVELKNVLFTVSNTTATNKVLALFHSVGWTGSAAIMRLREKVETGATVSAWLNENLIGHLYLRIQGSLSTFEDCVVHPSCQRMGIGTTIVKRALEAASSLGSTEVKLAVSNEHPELIDFYSRFGFRVTGEETETAKHMLWKA